MNIDIHNHLGRNGANPGFDKTIDIVAKRLGEHSIFGIANSDDHRYENFVEQEEGEYDRCSVGDDKRAVYVPQKKVLIVKCQEVSSKQGDILAIAMPYKGYIQTKDTKDTIKEAKDLGAILDAVHPFYILDVAHTFYVSSIGNFLKQNPKYLEFFSSWEVYNGSADVWIPGFTPRYANKDALDFYSREILLNPNLEIGISASTDAHSTRAIGKCYTEIEDFDLSSCDLVNNLDQGFRAIKSLYDLHMVPNIFDTLQSSFNVGLSRLLDIVN